MFGREVRLPVDVMFGNTPNPVQERTDYAIELRSCLEKAFELENTRRQSRNGKGIGTIAGCLEEGIKWEIASGSTHLLSQEADLQSCISLGRDHLWSSKFCQMSPIEFNLRGKNQDVVLCHEHLLDMPS